MSRQLHLLNRTGFWLSSADINYYYFTRVFICRQEHQTQVLWGVKKFGSIAVADRIQFFSSSNENTNSPFGVIHEFVVESS